MKEALHHLDEAPRQYRCGRKEISLIRFVIVTVAAILLTGATAAIASPYSFSDYPSQDDRCIGDKGVGDTDRSENACLEQIGELARRAGPSLQLKFTNRKTEIYLSEDAKCQSHTADRCVRSTTGDFRFWNFSA